MAGLFIINNFQSEYQSYGTNVKNETGHAINLKRSVCKILWKGSYPMMHFKFQSIKLLENKTHNFMVINYQFPYITENFKKVYKNRASNG